MEPEKIKELFLMFSQEQEDALHLTYLTAAQDEVQQQLKPDYAEHPPTILNAYAAAIAVRLWTLTAAIRQHTVCTEAGGITASFDNAAQRSAACAMVSAYRAMCRDYLKDDAFLLIAAPELPRPLPSVTAESETEKGDAAHD